MQQEETTIFQSILEKPTVRRRKLLPVWIKIFIWLFMIIGALTPFIVALGLTGAEVELALYGLQTTTVLSLAGLIITGLFVLKGIAAFGLWTGKDWGISVAIIDAVVGIAACLFIMLALPFINQDFNLTLRLELVFLIPYLVKLLKIRPLWIEEQGH